MLSLTGRTPQDTGRPHQHVQTSGLEGMMPRRCLDQSSSVLFSDF